MRALSKSAPASLLILNLLFLTPADSNAIGKAQKRKENSSNTRSRALNRADLKSAEARLAEMGYGTGRNGLVAFQKYEGRKITGQLNRDELAAIMSSSAPQAKDPGYKHVEVDLDRQVLLLTDDAGAVTKILPVSTGSEKHYREKGMSGLAYTPRGRFRIYSKIGGWRKSPLGLLYYPNYFSDGLAIHGNPSVPQTPQSHGCIRVPMSAAVDVYKQLPVGTIVLIYDKQSFVSAKEWIGREQ